MGRQEVGEVCLHPPGTYPPLVPSLLTWPCLLPLATPLPPLPPHYCLFTGSNPALAWGTDHNLAPAQPRSSYCSRETEVIRRQYT